MSDFLTLVFGADTGGLDDAKEKLSGIGAQMPTIGSGLESLFRGFMKLPAAAGLAAAGAVGLLASLEGLSDAGEKAANSIGDIGEKAAKIGVSTTFLQEFGAVAATAGGSVESFQSSMQRFSKQVGDAQRGTGQLKGALEELGIKLRDQNGHVKNSEQLFQEYRQKVSEVTDANKQLSLSAAAFGREGGAEMLGTLRATQDEVDATIAKANEYGIVIDEAVIRNAKEAADKLELMNMALKSQHDQAAVTLAPLAMWWGDVKVSIGNATIEVLKFFGAIDDFTEKHNGQSLAKLSTEVDTLRKKYEQYLDLFEHAGNMEDQGYYAQQAEYFRKQVEQYDKLIAAKKKAQEVSSAPPPPPVTPEQDKSDADRALKTRQQLEAQLHAAQIANIQEVTSRIAAQADEEIRLNKQKLQTLLQDENLTAQQRATFTQLIAQQNAQIEITARQQMHAQMLKEDEKYFKDQQKQQEQALQEQIDAQIAAMQVTIDMPQVNIPDYSGWKGVLLDYYDTAKRYDKDWKGAFAGSIDTATNALTTFVTTGKFNFKSFASSIIADLARIAIQKAIVGAIGGALGGIFGDGGIFSGGSQITANAKGNPYSNGVISQPTVAPMALFGEKDPEAIMPLSRGADGRLGVAAQGGGGSRGPSVTNNYNITQNIGSVDSAERLRESTRSLKDMIISAARETAVGDARKGNWANPLHAR
jgi:lambda family phage tail tape measure protein